MKKIGLTGSIGSGKTTVCKIFSLFGTNVYQADDEAKKFLDHDEVKNNLVKKFGKSILDNKNTIDKKILASIVFYDNDALKWLNSIIHPLVISDFESWCELFNNESYVIHEAAILYETGFYKDFDAIISVSAPEELRIKRVMERDNMNRQDVLVRMANQWTDIQKAEFADYVIFNDEKRLLIPQIIQIDKKLRKNRTNIK